jgi:hypothetical protein
VDVRRRDRSEVGDDIADGRIPADVGVRTDADGERGERRE